MKPLEMLAMYGDDAALAAYNFSKVRSQSEELKKKPRFTKQKVGSAGREALVELTKKASAAGLPVAKATDLPWAFRRGMLYGGMATPVLYEEDMAKTRRKLYRLKKDIRRNPEVIKAVPLNLEAIKPIVR